MKTLITKKKYAGIVWATIIIGLILNTAISYFFISSGVTETQMRLGFWMSISLIIVGFGMGMAYAHTFRIK